MARPGKRKPRRFTYSDYLGWPDDERWEVIDGQAWAMSPSPGEAHQRASVRLSVEFFGYFRDRGCQVYAAPFDVVLSEHDIVQPDLLVVCDGAKIKETHISGAPDLVVEILSARTAAKDRRETLDLYERHGVREYLMANLEEKLIEQHVLSGDGRYGRSRVFTAGETYRSAIFKGLRIDLASVLGWEAGKAAPGPGAEGSPGRRGKGRP